MSVSAELEYPIESPMSRKPVYPDRVLEKLRERIDSVPAGPWCEYQDAMMESFEEDAAAIIHSLDTDVSINYILLNYLRTNEIPYDKYNEVQERLGQLVFRVEQSGESYKPVMETESSAEVIMHPSMTAGRKSKSTQGTSRTAPKPQDLSPQASQPEVLSLPTETVAHKLATVVRDFVLGINKTFVLDDWALIDHSPIYLGCRLAMRDDRYALDGCSTRLTYIASRLAEDENRTSSVLRGLGERSADFVAQANCRGLGPDLFFPERGASVREAKEICRGCIAREDCLEFALSNGEKFGIWGQMSERQRRRLRKERTKIS